MAAARGETKAIGLRVNPAFSMDGGTGGTSKFGIDESDLPALKILLQTLPAAVCGLHIHLRSQNLSADTLARYYKTASRWPSASAIFWTVPSSISTSAAE